MNDRPSASVHHAKVAQNLLSMREHRSRYFGSEIFDEHAWTMLLHLFVEQSAHQKTSESRLYHLVDVSHMVGKRWLNHLVQIHHVSVDDDEDEVTLTSTALERMTAFLESEALSRNRD
ncbi:hypothetical protein ASG67_16325 [Sphingomonas sp. Leaf339]|uniref:hypothetical protein n=1 Tax=Sphingomonas sp. Leaf339 TaxID=1736343 RepID=UPI0006FC4D72|nr:hypothetical protein [Sphingomonas sp. Leaf339]KQU61566.1 hypothetical protein ASG67_16325 [Sphingomonas sp. Leaf339]